MRIRLPIVLAVLCVSLACSARQPASPGPAGDALRREARAFMEGYARELAAGDREGIVRRYHPDGAYRVGMGTKTFETYDSIAAVYRGDAWNKPAAFAWCDLSFEPVGTDGVAVAGRFLWSLSPERTLPFTYTAVLVRHDGALRIRLEDEDPAPRDAPALPCTARVDG
jgi:hypothetical protein